MFSGSRIGSGCTSFRYYNHFYFFFFAFLAASAAFLAASALSSVSSFLSILSSDDTLRKCDLPLFPGHLLSPCPQHQPTFSTNSSRTCPSAYTCFWFCLLCHAAVMHVCVRQPGASLHSVRAIHEFLRPLGGPISFLYPVFFCLPSNFRELGDVQYL